uniref:Uncharacterized protein n=1 Tax=Coccidioides posadasii RMSCC 3488 TaxID=454284 RepID=A0A0J6IHX4_COCPO|nr:hypothetical protein CPAG_07749 [Coccidioides posadasii RMSCC 3488]
MKKGEGARPQPGRNAMPAADGRYGVHRILLRSPDGERLFQHTLPLCTEHEGFPSPFVQQTDVPVRVSTKNLNPIGATLRRSHSGSPCISTLPVLLCVRTIDPSYVNGERVIWGQTAQCEDSRHFLSLVPSQVLDMSWHPHDGGYSSPSRSQRRILPMPRRIVLAQAAAATILIQASNQVDLAVDRRL